MSEKQALNKISEELIAMTAVRAALSVPGVNHLSDNNLIDRIVGKDTLAKGIKVSKDKEKITLDVFIVADYGVKIPQLAWDIQTAVKEHVLKITNKKISAVNIHVQGVALPKRFRRNDE